MTSNGRPAGDPEAPQPEANEASPSPGVLRATRAYLLPRAMRRGFEEALHEVCEVARDEGMGELEVHPVLALARAIVEDLDSALAAIPELDQMITGGSTGVEEREGGRLVKTLEDGIRPQLGILRRMQEELRRALDRGPGNAGSGA